jgi:RNA polymerase sigma factor (sigma-70 family)
LLFEVVSRTGRTWCCMGMGSACSGDDAEVFAAVYPGLRRFAGAVRPLGVEADDLVQEAVARTLAARSLCGLEHPAAYLRTAIMRVAINEERSRRRRSARAARAADRENGRIDSYPSDLADLWLISARERAVLFLTVVERRSYREAADAIGCSEPAARQMALRALRSLRVQVGAELHGGDGA